MENTIENAARYYDINYSDPLKDTADVLVGYADLISASKDQRIAELEKHVEELGGQSILDTFQRNKALRDDNADLQREIASLRSRLAECRRNLMMG